MLHSCFFLRVSSSVYYQLLEPFVVKHSTAFKAVRSINVEKLHCKRHYHIRRNGVLIHTSSYTPGEAIIAYKDLGGNAPSVAYTKFTPFPSISDGYTFDWTTGTVYLDRREYALKYILDPGCILVCLISTSVDISVHLI